MKTTRADTSLRGECITSLSHSPTISVVGKLMSCGLLWFGSVCLGGSVVSVACLHNRFMSHHSTTRLLECVWVWKRS